MDSKTIGDRQSEELPFQERPIIYLIDVYQKIADDLASIGFNLDIGSFGNVIDVPNTKRGDVHPCLLNHNLARNIHEYDIIVIDTQPKEPIEYIKEKHNEFRTKQNERRVVLCEYPQNVFDPRPYVSYVFRNDINSFLDKKSILIVFADDKESVDYKLGEYNSYGLNEKHEFSRNNYDFLESIPRNSRKSGKMTKVNDELKENFRQFLNKFNSDFQYYLAFEHPEIWNSESQKSEKDRSFIPLIFSNDNDIVSYAKSFEESVVFVFPQIQEKGEFLKELLNSILPEFKPELFPFNTKFSWLKKSRYRLPNESELIKEKKLIEKEYNEAIEEVDVKLQRNYSRYKFLHTLLTATGSELVESIEKYLIWLGFKNVKNMDEISPDSLEEDLQVELNDGLLVIEAKGIGGTSTDKECAQVNKYKNRRAEERKKFDVYGLYIVNHQRYLPPEIRDNPPFSEEQINDAKFDKRGLLTTYQLFKLYFWVESGYIQKSDVRNKLTDHGLVDFEPSNATFIGKPNEIHHNGRVIIITLDGKKVSNGDKFLIKRYLDLYEARIENIQINNEDVESVAEGEVGIKLDKSVTLESELWLDN